MTGRLIDPSNYLDLAGGREDIAVQLEHADKMHALRLRVEALLPTLALAELEAIVARIESGNERDMQTDDDEIEPDAHFEGSFS